MSINEENLYEYLVVQEISYNSYIANNLISDLQYLYYYIKNQNTNLKLPIATKGIHVSDNKYKEIFLKSLSDYNNIINNPKLLINDYNKLKNYINNLIGNHPEKIYTKNIEYRIPWEHGPPIKFDF